jgi:hypothetical protein
MELPESADMKPPKREINLLGGLLDIYTTVLFWQGFNFRMAIGNCPIQLRTSP